MKKRVIVILSAFVLLSCGGVGNKYDGLILIDPQTKKKYLLKHNIGSNYFVKENQTIISGIDTLVVFR
jgi:hypothetical protein